MGFTFLLGGARSGKSSLAVRIATSWGTQVTFVATAEAKDDEMSSRIGRHRDERPPGWDTIEAPRSLTGALEKVDSASGLIVDCISFWVANQVMDGVAAAAIEEEASSAVDALASRAGQAIAVSNEVGLGLVPDNELGRTFRDVLGRVNALAASRATAAYLVVAGRVLAIEEFPLDLERREPG
jgi:adenosyl cobinamide kinase/adenosyl cobinamide phosphate guanylyltransferase